MYITKAGVKVRSQKASIIKMHEKEGMTILNIAEEYHISESSMYKYFSRWGVNIIRTNAYQKREVPKNGHKKWKHWKRKFSKIFVSARAARDKRYGNKIKYVKTVNDARDQRLIRNILNRAYM